MASPKDNGIFRRNGINYLVPFVLITTLFFLWGFARAILDVLNKHFQNELSISITQSSLIQVTTYMGYFLMAATHNGLLARIMSASAPLSSFWVAQGR